MSEWRIGEVRLFGLPARRALGVVVASLCALAVASAALAFLWGLNAVGAIAIAVGLLGFLAWVGSSTMAPFGWIGWTWAEMVRADRLKERRERSIRRWRRRHPPL
jgi:hypothetical protein